MKKKIMSVIAVVLMLLTITVIDLYSTAKLSEAHNLAVKAIQESSLVKNTVGNLRHVVLVGAKDHLRPNSVSCASRTYLLIGNRGFEFVAVILRKTDYQMGRWEVVEIVEGYFTERQSKCSA